MSNDIDDKKLNIDISDYWLIIRKRLVLILAIFLMVLGASILYTLKQPPVYQAECKIKISARQPMATIQGAQISWYGANKNELSSEIKLMSNKDAILKDVLKILNDRIRKNQKSNMPDEEYYSKGDLNYIDRLEFSPAAARYIKGLKVDNLRGIYSIDPLPQSNIVSIYAKGPYRSVCKALATLLAIVYRADYWKGKTQDAKETMLFIERQLKEVIENLNKNKVSLEKSSMQKNTMGSAEIYKEELAKRRIELEKLRERYQDKHPRVVKQLKMIASLEKKLSELPHKEQKYNDHYAEWEQQMALRKSLGEYFQKAKIDYEAKLLKTKDEIQIIAKPKEAAKLKPNETMNIVAGALFGVILGCLFAFVWEGLDTSIGKIEDVERITKLPVIAHIPIIGSSHNKTLMALAPFRTLWINLVRVIYFFFPFLESEKKIDIDTKLIINLDPLAIESEAYRTLRTNIHFAIGTARSNGNVIEITSTSPREGKTLTSTNLAIEIAKMGKATLLIEADMRRPQIASLFKLNEKPGLSDLLIETADKSEAIRTITDILMGNSEWDKLTEVQGIDNLHIIPCGTIPPNPTELLLSNEFKKLIDNFKEEYDFIIIDTPPTLPVSDSSIISPVVDGVVLVYQSDKTSRHLLLRAIQTLKKNRANLVGIVINQLSFDVILRSERGGYSYSYKQ